MATGTGKIAFRTRSEEDVLDDGYKWRKYGKKSVKNSPNPRYVLARLCQRKYEACRIYSGARYKYDPVCKVVLLLLHLGGKNYKPV